VIGADVDESLGDLIDAAGVEARDRVVQDDGSRTRTHRHLGEEICKRDHLLLALRQDLAKPVVSANGLVSKGGCLAAREFQTHGGTVEELAFALERGFEGRVQDPAGCLLHGVGKTPQQSLEAPQDGVGQIDPLRGLNMLDDTGEERPESAPILQFEQRRPGLAQLLVALGSLRGQIPHGTGGGLALFVQSPPILTKPFNL